MTLFLLMNLGFAGGTASAGAFQPAWAIGANVVVAASAPK